ncbi:unnamed protein product, partial [Closterium sp. NIES-53]
RSNRPMGDWLQQARWATGVLNPRTIGAADVTTATSGQPPPTVPHPFHTPLIEPLAPLTRHPPRTTPTAPTHPPPSAVAAAVGDGGGGGEGDGSHTRHPDTLHPQTLTQERRQQRGWGAVRSSGDGVRQGGRQYGLLTGLVQPVTRAASSDGGRRDGSSGQKTAVRLGARGGKKNRCAPGARDRQGTARARGALQAVEQRKHQVGPTHRIDPGGSTCSDSMLKC